MLPHEHGEVAKIKRVPTGRLAMDTGTGPPKRFLNYPEAPVSETRIHFLPLFPSLHSAFEG